MNFQLILSSYLYGDYDHIIQCLRLLKDYPEYVNDYKLLSPYDLDFYKKLNFFYANYYRGYDHIHYSFIYNKFLNININKLINKLELYVDNGILKSMADSSFLDELNYELFIRLGNLEDFNPPKRCINDVTLPVVLVTDIHTQDRGFPFYVYDYDLRVRAVLKNPEMRKLSNKWIFIGAKSLFEEFFKEDEVCNDLKQLIKYLCKLGIMYNKNNNLYCTINIENCVCYSRYHDNTAVPVLQYVKSELLNLFTALNI